MISANNAAVVAEPYADAHLDAPLELCGERLCPDLSGALFWPARSVLVVADLHFEKGAAIAARGQPLPPYDTPDTLSEVENAVARFNPATIIALGDSFHTKFSETTLSQNSITRIRRLTDRHDWIWIAGNHDPHAPSELGGRAAQELELGPFTFRHEPRPASSGAAQGEICGHLHPVAKLSVRGRTMRRRCFATCGTRLVMPAMGAYTGGLNVLDQAFSPLFARNSFHAWMIGAKEIHRVAASKLRPDRRGAK